MPCCRRDGEDAVFKITLEETMPTPEWREPPGRLGDYVRRVKRLSAALPRRAGQALL